MPDHYAVIGNPITHSLSPKIHQQFAKQTNQHIHYEKIFSEYHQFEKVLKNFFQQGGKGANITIPFKNQAYQFMDHLHPAAKIAGTVNTVIRKGNLLIGDNTDGIGLVRDLKENFHYVIENKNILILGAGGAVAGIIHPLQKQHPKKITIANRTIAKANQLAKRFESYGRIVACGYHNLPAPPYDLVINGTSTSSQGIKLPIDNDILAVNSCCYDLCYQIADNPFLHWSSQQGASIVTDGLGMLLEQAAASFYLWRGIRPNTRWCRKFIEIDNKR